MGLITVKSEYCLKCCERGYKPNCRQVKTLSIFDLKDYKYRFHCMLEANFNLELKI